MARNYKPYMPFNVAMQLLIPVYSKSKGVIKKSFSDENAPIIYGSFRTFGGTESEVNGVFTVINTATIDTWYRPDIKSDCRIKIIETDEVYEVYAKPENINMRNQFMQLKVREVGGGA